VYLSQEFLTFGDGDASLEDARGAAVVDIAGTGSTSFDQA
jgi:hypothetical protein